MINGLKLVLAITLCSVLGACEMMSKVEIIGRSPSVSQQSQPQLKTIYTVQRGDTLAEIAKETTGSIDNWRSIANHNNIDDPATLKIGDVIEIPPELSPTPPSQRAAAPGPAPAPAIAPVVNKVAIFEPIGEPVVSAPEKTEPMATASTDSAASVLEPVLPGIPLEDSGLPQPLPVEPTTQPLAAEPGIPETLGEQQLDEQQQAQLLQATVFQPEVSRTETAAPEHSPAQPALQTATGGNWIVLKGSYYPREIKVAPSVGAATLLLAWPGTRLEYVQNEDGWYKVVTGTGAGYVSLNDAQPE